MKLNVKEVQMILRNEGYNLELCSETEDVITCRLNDDFDTKKVRIINLNQAKDR